MAPLLIFENLTLELGALASTSSGFPESVEQPPRAIPGLVGSAVVG